MYTHIIEWLVKFGKAKKLAIFLYQLSEEMYGTYQYNHCVHLLALSIPSVPESWD